MVRGDFIVRSNYNVMQCKEQKIIQIFACGYLM